MMNRIILVMAVTLLLFSGTGAGAVNLQDGVLGYKWGDSPSEHGGVVELGNKEDVSYYSKPGEIYVIGDVSVEKVIYGFYENQLFGVYLNIDSIEVYDKLLRHLNSRYGLPGYKTTAENLSIYKWKQRDVTIKLKMNKKEKTMKLACYYRPLSSKLHATQWEDLDSTSFHFVPIEMDKKPEKFVLFKF